MTKQKKDYSDMIDLAHHVSKTRPHMSMADRAAQFSPFAALTGYGEAVRETARLTGKRIELNEDEQAELDRKLQIIRDHLDDAPLITITWFKPDDRKEGGALITTEGTVIKMDLFRRILSMADGTNIPIPDITGIEGGVMDTYLI